MLAGRRTRAEQAGRRAQFGGRPSRRRANAGSGERASAAGAEGLGASSASNTAIRQRSVCDERTCCARASSPTQQARRAAQKKGYARILRVANPEETTGFDGRIPSGVVETYASGFSQINGLSFDGGGNLYVLEYVNGS